MASIQEKELRAAQAKRLLEDPILSEAFATVRQRYIDAMIATPRVATEERDSLHLSIHALEDVHNQLKSIVTDYSLAKR